MLGCTLTCRPNKYFDLKAVVCCYLSGGYNGLLAAAAFANKNIKMYAFDLAVFLLYFERFLTIHSFFKSIVPRCA